MQVSDQTSLAGGFDMDTVLRRSHSVRMLLQFGRRAALTAHTPKGLLIFESSRKTNAWFDYPPYHFRGVISPESRIWTTAHRTRLWETGVLSEHGSHSGKPR